MLHTSSVHHSLTARLVLIAATMGAVIPLSAQRINVGRPLGAFTLANLRGDSVTLASYRGRPLIVKFWATWCPTCRTEMPEVAAARTGGVEVMTINGEDQPVRIQRYLASLGPVAQTLPVLLDPHSHLGNRFGVPVLPTTLFVDTGGVVRTAHYGAITPAEFAAGVRSIQPSAGPE